MPEIEIHLINCFYPPLSGNVALRNIPKRSDARSERRHGLLWDVMPCELQTPFTASPNIGGIWQQPVHKVRLYIAHIPALIQKQRHSNVVSGRLPFPIVTRCSGMDLLWNIRNRETADFLQLEYLKSTYLLPSLFSASYLLVTLSWPWQVMVLGICVAITDLLSARRICGTRAAIFICNLR